MSGELAATHRRLLDAGWALSFAGLGLMTLALMRPSPVFPAPSQSRIVIDARGHKVVIPQPFKTIGGSEYLEATHAPETLFKVGGPGDRVYFATMLMSRFYPEVLKTNDLWNAPPDIESLLAQADGVTFKKASAPALWGRIGLPILETFFGAGTRDEMTFSSVRVLNSARGDAAHGEALVAEYKQAYAELKQELQPETLTERPRVLTMGSAAQNWSTIWVNEADRYNMADNQITGVLNATSGYENTGRQQETERILAMNPDIIFNRGEGVHDVWNDPRWQGLKAVLNKRVYNLVLLRAGNPTYNLDERPLEARWEAEIAHPDRLQPKLRALMRAHYLKAYGYHLSDDDLDDLLYVNDDAGAIGCERFIKIASMNERSELAQ